MDMILPKPKSIEIMQGEYTFPKTIKLYSEGISEKLTEVAKQYFSVDDNKTKIDLEFKRITGLKTEEYVLEIKEDKVTISYSEYPGAMRAFATYCQIYPNKKAKCQKICDWPDLPVRGFLLDISRDKIPTMETMMKVTDLMFMAKMNHFELYVEGFPVYLKSFPDLPYEDPIKPEEMNILEKYCLDRGIDFVRNINTFGHMTSWLALPKYHKLAECEDGYSNYGYPFPASTLNPNDPNSIELIKKMIADAIGDSRSAYFNVNGDEPFELGLGKSKDQCLSSGRGKVYLAYMEKVMNTVRNYGKRPIIWGDVFNEDPSLYNMVRNDVIICDWGYDSEHDFETPAKRMEAAGKDFLLAPGTSTWNSFSGRFEDMRDSISNAVSAAKNHHGKGILLTDWGDYSHPQTLPFSFPGIILAATASWGEKSNFEMLEKWLDINVFHDLSSGLANKIVELSKYHMLEDFNVSNGTMTFASWMFVDPDKNHPLMLKQKIWEDAIAHYRICPDNANRIFTLVQTIENSLKNNNNQVKNEIIQTCELIEICVIANQVANGNRENCGRALSLIEKVMDSYGKIWLERNRKPGLEKSLLHLEIITFFLQNNPLNMI